jgi:hypothetical protein
MAKLHGKAKAAFLAKMAAGRSKGHKSRTVGRKRAAKVVKAVAKATVVDTKKIKKIAKKVTKKVAKAATHVAGHRVKKVKPTKVQTAVAAAAKQVADQCAKELKEVRAKAEMALALGNIGRGLRTATTGYATHREAAAHHRIKGLKTRIHHLREKAKHKHPAHPAHHPHPAHRPHPAATVHAARPQTLHYTAGMKGKHKKPRHAIHREHEVTASQILGGVRAKGKKGGRGKAGKAFDFWVCAGPVRTGCGHGGSFVLGDMTKHEAIRLH